MATLLPPGGPGSGTSTSTTSSITGTTTSTTTSTSTSTTTTSSSTTSTSTSTSSSSSTSTTSSTTSTSSTSTTTSAITTSTTPTTSSTPSISIVSTPPITQTSTGPSATVIVFTTPTPTVDPTPQTNTAGTSSKGFFHNTGAVAGVFSVVGVVALVLVVALGTNAIRRRRAKKFDEEVAAAAAEASKTPHYPFDDYDDPAPGGGYGISAYSDPDSHGSLGQAPMSHVGESYNMAEYPGYGPTAYATGAGAAALGAGAAGMGVNRALSRRDHQQYYDSPSSNVAGFGSGLNRAPTVRDQQPYGAFVMPHAQVPGQDPYYDNPTVSNAGAAMRHRPSGSRDLIDAAGLGGAAAAGGAYLNRGPSSNTSASGSSQQQLISRKQSQATSRVMSPEGRAATTASSGHESYAAHYQPDFRPDEYNYQPPPGAAPIMSKEAEPAMSNPFAKGDSNDDDEAYGVDSYVPVRPDYVHEDSSRMSLKDDDDYGRVGRTLKVANE